MSFNINVVVMCGVNLTKDAELKFAANGNPRASFAVAYNTEWKDQSGAVQKKVEYFNVVYWGKLAEKIAQYLKKGVRVDIKGRLTQRRWQGQDGQNHQAVEIAAESILLTSSKKDEDQGNSRSPSYQQSRSAQQRPSQVYQPAAPAYDDGGYQGFDDSPLEDSEVPF